MQEGKEITRRNFIKLALVGTLGLTGCAKAIDKMVMNTEPVDMESVPSATAKATEAKKVLASATPEAPVTIHLENAGGPYTAAQEALNNSESAKKDKDTLELWVNNYWTAPEFKNRPFEKNSKDLHTIYVYDDLQNPTEVKALLQVTGDYNGRTFTVPFGANGPAEFPPKVEGDYIQEGYGPLELTAGNENWRLSVENGVFVRRDKSSNEVMEKLDYKSRQWVEAETRLNKEKFNRFPQNYEALLANLDEYLESPDPVTNRAEFDKWWNEIFLPLLGAPADREVNIRMDAFVNEGNGIRGAWAKDNVHGTEVVKQPQFFYFKNEGKISPVLVFNVEPPWSKGKTNFTMVLILCDGEYRVGTKALSKISSGEKIVALRVVSQKLSAVDPEINKFIDAGIIPVIELTNDKKPPMFGASIIDFGQ